jgi:hypothetical protein
MTREDDPKKDNAGSLSQAILDSFHPSLLRLQTALRKEVKTTLEAARRVVSASVRVEESLQTIFQQTEALRIRINELIDELPEPTRVALRRLGERGWYFCMDMTPSEIYENANRIQAGNYTEVDQWMIAFYNDNLDSLKNDLEERFPHRSQVLERAFEAHERGEYELSVPVFLAQADGICQELTDIQLYSRIEGQPRTLDFVEQLALESLSDAMMEPLRVPLPISASYHDREQPDYPSGALNRHQVLHGEAADYGTEMNSCKAISLLHYVATVLDPDFLEE